MIGYPIYYYLIFNLWFINFLFYNIQLPKWKGVQSAKARLQWIDSI
jgi:hypothetical protein